MGFQLEFLESGHWKGLWPTWSDVVVVVLHLNHGVGDPSFSQLVSDHTLDASVNLKHETVIALVTFQFIMKLDLIRRASWFFHLLHVKQQRFPVVFPLNRELAGMRELVTGQLHCHLEAVSVQVAEVIHTWKRRLCCKQKIIPKAGLKEENKYDMNSEWIPHDQQASFTWTHAKQQETTNQKELRHSSPHSSIMLQSEYKSLV